GAWALFPSLGTAAVLIAGSGEHRKADVARVLATPPMQAIGRISYAWYLWHWPTLLLGLTLVDGQNPWHLLLLAVLSLGLAIASYQLGEGPLRRSAVRRARPRTVLVSGILLMVAALVGSIAWGNLSLRWSQTPQQVQLGK